MDYVAMFVLLVLPVLLLGFWICSKNQEKYKNNKRFIDFGLFVVFWFMSLIDFKRIFSEPKKDDVLYDVAKFLSQDFCQWPLFSININTIVSFLLLVLSILIYNRTSK